MGVVKPFVLVMLAANVINVPLCALFIVYLGMGADGAAICLVLMGLNLFGFCFAYIVRSGVYKGKQDDGKGERDARACARRAGLHLPCDPPPMPSTIAHSHDGATPSCNHCL